jgi:hypothetical protein
MLGRLADIDQHGAGLHEFDGAFGGNGLHGLVPIGGLLGMVTMRRAR